MFFYTIFFLSLAVLASKAKISHALKLEAAAGKKNNENLYANRIHTHIVMSANEKKNSFDFVVCSHFRTLQMPWNGFSFKTELRKKMKRNMLHTKSRSYPKKKRKEKQMNISNRDMWYNGDCGSANKKQWNLWNVGRLYFSVIFFFYNGKGTEKKTSPNELDCSRWRWRNITDTFLFFFCWGKWNIVTDYGGNVNDNRNMNSTLTKHESLWDFFFRLLLRHHRLSKFGNLIPSMRLK